ncbi:MAG: response regulator [Spirochaetales bacterium]|nr:response regulator [Spirochaetales bacterium]
MVRKRKKVKIYSALEVANICGVVNQTAINWIKKQHLKAFTTPGGQYRVYADDLYGFLRDRNMKIPDEVLELGENAKQTHILIIDDDRDLSNVLKGIISSSFDSAVVTQAFDGFEAGQLLFEVKPQLIILDINLPGVNGHKLCRKIKNSENLDNPVVISVSGMDNEVEGSKIIKEGADAFFQKPLEYDKFLGKIKELVNI